MNEKLKLPNMTAKDVKIVFLLTLMFLLLSCLKN